MVGKSATLFVFLIMCFLLAVSTHAAGYDEIQLTEREITLLAVSERGDSLVGTTAKVTLEVIPGKGRVFLDTTPLTKLDTQLSTRMAKEIACSYIDVDCSPYDFVYTVTSESPIVGGASAGAALATITVAALSNIPIPADVAVTGTINSGGVIGPVGGVVAKIEAAKSKDITNVGIPFGEKISSHTYPKRAADKYEDYVVENKASTEQTLSDIITFVNISDEEISVENKTESDTLTNNIDVIGYGQSQGIVVTEVISLDQLIHQLSGVRLFNETNQYQTPEFYQNTMQQVAEQMCLESDELFEKLNTKLSSEFGLSLADITSEGADLQDDEVLISLRDPLELANTLYKRSVNATAVKQYYGAASFCFGASIRFTHALYMIDEDFDMSNTMNRLEAEIASFAVPPIETITDLQTAMLVQERLLETEELLDEATIAGIGGDTFQARYLVAFAHHRLTSATRWSLFFDQPGKKAAIDNAKLALSCKQKLQETEDRKQYLGLYLPQYLTQVDDDLQKAYDSLDGEEYGLCLFYASQSKANYDVVIGTIGIDDDKVEDYLAAKQEVAATIIERQAIDDVYPIMAYSFLEYSQSLAATDPYSALLYTQYAIELGDLQVYFDEQGKSVVLQAVDSYVENVSETKAGYVLFFVLGILVASIIYHIERQVLALRYLKKRR